VDSRSRLRTGHRHGLPGPALPGRGLRPSRSGLRARSCRDHVPRKHAGSHSGRAIASRSHDLSPGPAQRARIGSRDVRPAPRSPRATRPARIPGILGDRAVGARSSAGSIEEAFAGPGYRGGPRSVARGIVETRAMAARGSRVLAVTIRPVEWDPETGETRFVESVTLAVAWDKPVPALAKP